MEEINLKELFKFFVDKICILILITVVAGMMGAFYTWFMQVPMYNSSTTLLLTKATGTGDITSSDITLNQKLIATYREIVKSNKVLKQVKNNLGLNYSVGKIAGNTSVSSVKDTEIIKITVSDVSPERAKNIALEISTIFSKEIKELYQMQNIGVVDAPEVAKNPYNVSPIKQIGLSGVLGFVLAMGILFMLYYFDTSVKSVEQVEQITGFPVIGVVPLRKGKRGW